MPTPISPMGNQRWANIHVVWVKTIFNSSISFVNLTTGLSYKWVILLTLAAPCSGNGYILRFCLLFSNVLMDLRVTIVLSIQYSPFRLEISLYGKIRPKLNTHIICRSVPPELLKTMEHSPCYCLIVYTNIKLTDIFQKVLDYFPVHISFCLFVRLFVCLFVCLFFVSWFGFVCLFLVFSLFVCCFSRGGLFFVLSGVMFVSYVCHIAFAVISNGALWVFFVFNKHDK